MLFLFDDAEQPRSRKSGYCGVRALVIATGMKWDAAEDHLRSHARAGRAGSGSISKGMFKDDYDAALRALGFIWKPAPRFVGRKARCADLPGTVIARQAHHYVAVTNGTARDIWDCSHKMVYGYWVRA